ncbi:hypothetical protein RHMOL_Rhmol01G0019400 [Rhododendron molle]|uniref:Uncharacterized protein n=1 Tax=Rhododendron molle TaxID=49168 RepID=A0ACC0Q0C8_RHOML|nr:hypothetical protein RHMOL_Rhmol01G0019400 [Rhododendron molle]
MGKQKSARKLSLRDFHDHICNDSSLSDVEVVSIVDEDSDFEVANEATIEVPKLPPQTSEAWPALKSPIVPGDKSTTLSGATAMSVEGNKLAGMNAWSSPITSPTKATKKGKLSKQLKKVPVVYENGKVMIPSTIAENGALKWKNAIVGSFVDKRLSYYQVSSWAHREWKIDTEDVVTLDNGFFVFKFKDEEVVDSIIENGPYFCGGKHVILVRWHPGMHLTKGAFSSVPVWVKLYNVPLECWNDEGLSYIASHIGNPLYPDEFTREHSRLTFARVCIEVEATKEIPESFVVDLGYGKPFEIRVEVPWKPQACKGEPPVDSKTITVRRSQSKLKKMDPPAPPVLQFIRQAGFGGVIDLSFISLDIGLMIALLERWRPETHLFHLRTGKWTATLQDLEVLLGLPVDGEPIIRSTNEDWDLLCQRLLEIVPENKVDRKGGKVR